MLRKIWLGKPHGKTAYYTHAMRSFKTYETEQRVKTEPLEKLRVWSSRLRRQINRIKIPTEKKNSPLGGRLYGGCFVSSHTHECVEFSNEQEAMRPPPPAAPLSLTQMDLTADFIF